MQLLSRLKKTDKSKKIYCSFFVITLILCLEFSSSKKKFSDDPSSNSAIYMYKNIYLKFSNLIQFLFDIK